MNFQEAQRKFWELESIYRAGQMDPVQYRYSLDQLRVIDSQGQAWEMQAQTGQWHVYQRGTWIPAQPPGTPGAYATSPSVRPPERSKRPWLWVLGIPVTLLVCLLVAGATYVGLRTLLGNEPISALIPSAPGEVGQPAPEPTLPPPTFTQLEVTQAQPGGSPVTDSHGVSLQVPKEAVEEGKSVQLTALEGSGGLIQALGEDIHLDTPLYRVSMPEGDDGLAGVELSFPAASPAARVLVVIDGQYPGLLDVAPENGRLNISAQPRPSQAEGGADGEGELLYTVITPASASGSTPVELTSVDPAFHLAALIDGPAALQQEAVKRCMPEVHWRGGVIAHCRENQAGTVQVKYYDSLGLQPAEADAVVLQVAAIMKRYQDAGFKAAELSPASPLYVVITSSETSPLYKVRNGVIYLPPDVARGIASGGQHELMHEMAHWIQDMKYNMTWAYFSGAKIWWLESAAENMVMLLDEAYIGMNLATYGKGDLDNGRTIFQGAPYVWPDDESYIQAQLLKVNLCDDAMICPLSAKTFAEAISNGTYPLEASPAQAQISDNLDDYARYLLGTRPEFANTSIPLSATVQSGEDYGEFVQLKQNNQSLFANQINGFAPQMVVDKNGSLPVISIEAHLEKDSVYPLKVYNAAGDHPALPATLTIQPGAPFWYRLGGGDPQYHDGSKELVLTPIHPKMGYQEVRLVALGEAGGEVFRAKVTPADFSGVWAFKPGKILVNNVTCTTTAESGESGLDFEGLLSFGSMLPIFGDFAQEGGTELRWTLDPTRLLEEMDLTKVVYQVEANLDNQGLHAHNYLEIPQDTSGFGSQPHTGWQAVLILAGAVVTLVLLRRISRKSALPISLTGLAAVALLLAACSAYIELFGTIDTKVDFQKIEYQGNMETIQWNAGEEQTPTGTWLLSGVATSTLDFTALSGSTFTNGDLSTEKQDNVDHCAGTVQYEMTVNVLQDVEIDKGGGSEE